MKKIRINKLSIIALSFLTFLVSCDKEEAVLVEPSHRVILTSEMDFGNRINPDENLSFGDVSAGVVSRTWTFPDNVVDIFGSDNDKTSTERTVNATFSTPGDYTVMLKQVFNDFPFSQAYKSQAASKELDTTIVVRVLAPVKINLTGNYLNDDGTLGAPLVVSDNALNEVTASKQVRFSYTIDGEPADFNWTFGEAGVDPKNYSGTNTEVDVKYKSLGNYDFKFIASRRRPLGADTIYLKDLIKVIPSTDPVFLDGVNENEGKIDLEFSRDMDPDSFNASTFTVTLENGGNVIPVNVTDAQIKSGENNIITITLNETVYADDIAKVSYTPGTLRTSDQVNATAFTDQIVRFGNIENILDTKSDYDYSFENSTAANWPYMWWGGIWGEYDLEISTAQAHTGNNSAYIEYRPNGGMIIGHRDDLGNDITFNVEAGKDYEIGVWVYLTDLGSPDATFVPDVRFYWFPDTDWSVGPNPGFSTDFKTNEWVYVSQFVQFSSSGDKTFQIRGWNEFNSQKVKFFMDDLSLKQVNLRP